MGNLILDSNWKVHWRMTESAGLAIYLADYQGKRVIWDASLPYVTVDHQRPDLAPDEATEPHGPFWAPLGLRSQRGEVRIEQFRSGFELAVDFTVASFRYTQLWRFHEDGKFAPWLTIHGGGLHDAHTYHPHWRFDLDVSGAASDLLERWVDGRWERVVEEGWIPYTGERADEGADEGAVWRQTDGATGTTVSIRPSHWEDAELYAVRFHHGEWPPFYPCSEPGAQPFPAAYVGAEPLDRADVALWYVAHVHFDAAFPFTAGPWMRVEGR